MKFRIIATVIVLVSCLFVSKSRSQEYINYQVKVRTDAMGIHKGTLTKIDKDGLSVNDGYGNDVVLKAENIMSIRLKKKSFTVAKGLLYGTICGAAIGSTALLGDLPDNSQLFLLASVTSAGVVAGVGYGLACELLANKMLLKINKDTNIFAAEYQKLEKYSKAYYIDKP